LEEQVKDGLGTSKAKIAPIEESGYQAARAISTERIEQITEAVARGAGWTQPTAETSSPLWKP
jgi:hypothetical protein